MEGPYKVYFLLFCGNKKAAFKLLINLLFLKRLRLGLSATFLFSFRAAATLRPTAAAVTHSLFLAALNLRFMLSAPFGKFFHGGCFVKKTQTYTT
jgi:hypothetical protein